MDEGKRVIHIGSFSKTIGPGLRLGFVVVPPESVLQLATARFMHDGHYIRRLRRLKRLYTAQRDSRCDHLPMRDAKWDQAGLAVLLRLPDGAPDVQIVREAMKFGMAPSPLSAWFATPSSAIPGLLLGVATVPEPYVATSCRQLFEIIDRYFQSGDLIRT